MRQSTKSDQVQEFKNRLLNLNTALLCTNYTVLRPANRLLMLSSILQLLNKPVCTGLRWLLYLSRREEVGLIRCYLVRYKPALQNGGVPFSATFRLQCGFPSLVIEAHRMLSGQPAQSQQPVLYTRPRTALRFC